MSTARHRRRSGGRGAGRGSRLLVEVRGHRPSGAVPRSDRRGRTHAISGHRHHQRRYPPRTGRSALPRRRPPFSWIDRCRYHEALVRPAMWSTCTGTGARWRRRPGPAGSTGLPDAGDITLVELDPEMIRLARNDSGWCAESRIDDDPARAGDHRRRLHLAAAGRRRATTRSSSTCPSPSRIRHRQAVLTEFYALARAHLADGRRWWCSRDHRLAPK